MESVIIKEKENANEESLKEEFSKTNEDKI